MNSKIDKKDAKNDVNLKYETVLWSLTEWKKTLQNK